MNDCKGLPVSEINCPPEIILQKILCRAMMVQIHQYSLYFACIEGRSVMQKIIFSIFLVLTLLCLPVLSTTAEDWFNNAEALWDRDRGRYTDPKRAIEYLNQAIMLQPNYVRAYNSRGNAYADLGMYKNAISDYDQALRLKPDYVYAYINRGDAYYWLGQYHRSVEDCSQAIRLKPDMATAYSNRGKAYAKMGQYQLAIEDFDEAIHLNTADVIAYNNRGIAYLLKGDKMMGCRDAQKACALGDCKVLKWAKRKAYCF